MASGDEDNEQSFRDAAYLEARRARAHAARYSDLSDDQLNDRYLDWIGRTGGGDSVEEDLLGEMERRGMIQADVMASAIIDVDINDRPITRADLDRESQAHPEMALEAVLQRLRDRVAVDGDLVTWRDLFNPAPPTPTASRLQASASRSLAQNTIFSMAYGGAREPGARASDHSDPPPPQTGLAAALTISPVCQVQVETQAPEGTAWIRQINGLVPDEEGMAMFAGRYLQPPVGSTSYWIQPGTLMVVATARRRRGVTRREPDSHDLQLYVYLPEDLWYPIREGALRQEYGWHARMRGAVSVWLPLTLDGRVIRACQDGRNELGIWLLGVRARSEVDQDAEEAIAQFERIQAAVMNHTPFVPPLSAASRDIIRADFLGWVARQANAHDTVAESVRNVVREEIGVPPIITESGTTPAATPKRNRAIENRQRRNIRIRSEN